MTMQKCELVPGGFGLFCHYIKGLKRNNWVGGVFIKPPFSRELVRRFSSAPREHPALPKPQASSFCPLEEQGRIKREVYQVCWGRISSLCGKNIKFKRGGKNIKDVGKNISVKKKENWKFFL